MAEIAVAAVSPFVWPLFNKLCKYVHEEINNNRNANENFIRLEETLLQAQKLADNLSLLQFQQGTTHTVETFTNLCYDVEDFVNEKREFNRLIWLSAHRTTKLLDEMSKKMDQNALKKREEEMERSLISELSQNKIANAYLIERKYEIEQIKEDLITHLPENNGVSIIGRRGLGKTALARFIYEDKKILRKFTHVWWFEVNVDHNILETTKKKLVAVDSKEHLLIILDNFLKESVQTWYDFWESIMYKMSKDNVKVLVTTLNPNVSELTNTKPYYLNPLPDPLCKNLIIHYARLYNDEIPREPSLEVLVKKCEGLPLLAKIVGQRLAARQLDEGLNLKEIWEWDDFNKDIFPLLKRSYKNMPPGLIKCFAYFSLFPHNHEFRVIVSHERENHNNIDDLFQLWVSEGFVIPLESSLTFENTCKKYLNELLERSLLQCDESGKVYKLQRLNQKIAEVASSKTCLRVDNVVPTSLPKNTRHLSLLRENFKVLESKRRLKRLRTILSLNDKGRGDMELQIPTAIFNKRSSLRVLSLSGFNIQYIPSSIGSLIHLRYLDVSRTPIGSLPNELATLFNLLVLKLTKTTHLYKLPDNFSQMSNLQCVGWDIGDIERLRPSNIGKLSKLQALPLFCVDIVEGFFIGELKNMDHLQSSICIKNLENVLSREDAEEAMLSNKKLLTTMELEWNGRQRNSNSAEVLEGLKPHDGLSKLKITRYSGNNFPAWISNSSLKLRELHLYECYCSSLPALGQLKELKSLVLEGMSNLIQVDDQFCGHCQDTDPYGSFLSLEFLEINDMAELQRWTLTELQHKNMPRLRHLRFIDCPKMSEFSSLQNLESLEELEIQRCPKVETLPKLPKSLKSLKIGNSDKLESNYIVGSERWDEISRIPSLLIANQDISPAPLDQHHQNDQVKVVLSTMDKDADQTVIGKGKSHTEINNNEFSDVSGSNNDDDGRGQSKRKGPSNNSSPSTSRVEKNENDQPKKPVGCTPAIRSLNCDGHNA